MACRPPAPRTIPIRNRSFGSRPMGASILPVSRVGVPSTIARYLRRTDLRANCSCKPACAAASFAITSNPEVPLSMRCTTPSRGTLDIFSPLQWNSSAFTRLPLGCPADGCTTIPGGLLTMIRCSSSNTTSRGMSSGTTSLGGGAMISLQITLSPLSSLCEGLVVTCPLTTTTPFLMLSTIRLRLTPDILSARNASSLGEDARATKTSPSPWWKSERGPGISSLSRPEAFARERMASPRVLECGQTERRNA
mmetsp:Transcript_1618/g.7207  ORF Transcript_1618/g.7207 Transcript_1618/m.7207 type:complete len:251 (+) Transcript_1618:3664-4416(+)